MNYENIFDEETVKAIKKLATGMVVTEITKEYAMDEGEMKLTKKKVNQKVLPPNTDIVKMIYLSAKENVSKYKEMTEEQLLYEKKRLLLELEKEQSNGD